MEFIIFLIIAAVIGNIVKAASQQAQQTGRTGRGGRGFPEVRPVDTGSRGVPGSKPAGYGRYSVGTSGRRTEPFSSGGGTDTDKDPDPYYEDEYNRFSGESSSGMDPAQPFSESVVSQPMQVERVTKTRYRHRLDFTPDSILNGIIMSEVLGPPKARRR
ncbi:MAG: hypothetical protein ACOX27_11510 [Caldicoprobacterales bacterium]|jgi:hypothetical protein|nr:hypothetical protein [Clostridiales bacterium]